ncbi:MAG: glycoside hydrolase, partial [Acidobacteriota bacterium]|nr:glycoside hydrolase [Acidobacteriota bacterium]
MRVKTTKRFGWRFFIAAAAAACLLWLALAGAHASVAEVNVAGSAAGAFADATGAATGPTLKGLGYYRSDFNATTSNGTAALSGAPYSPSSNATAANVNNLGSFYLQTPAVGTNDVYTGSTFNLQVTFTAPAQITGGQQATFNAQLNGAVVRTSSASSYSINVDFDNTPKVFNYTRSDGTTGAFALIVNDVNGITPNLAKAITGTISVVAPAPTSATSGTINSSNTPSNPLSYTAGPFYVPNASGAAGLQCNSVLQCNDFRLHVDLPAGLIDTKQVRVGVSWPLSNADFDITAYAQNPDSTPGQAVASSGTSADPEVMILPAVAGDYVIRIVPFNPLGQTATAAIWVEDKTNNFTPGTGTAPQFVNYPAPGGLGTDSGEPSIGYDPKTDSVMFQASLQTLKVKFDDTKRPAAATWEDKSYLWTSLASLDPILFTDQKTGRTIVSQLAGTDSFSAFTDDGGGSWTPTEGGPMTSGVDHQTVGGGPYHAPVPQGVNPVYPNAIYYCSQDLYTAFCARSDDGGLTFGPAVPMYTTECGGIHGHVKVGPDGTVYVPNRQCGTNQGVAISDDNGVTWRVSKIVDGDQTTSSGDSIPGNWDPSVGVGAGGTVYVGYDNGDGRPHVAVSKDRGHSWVLDQNVGHDLNIRDTAFPAVTAGDDDRAAFAFLGAQTSPGSNDAVWHLYVATTYDGGNSWITTDATPNDPVQLGTICAGGISCSGGDRNLLDFIDATVDSQGRTLVGYADGCIGCTSPGGSRAHLATIARQQCGRRLYHANDPQTDDCNTAATPTPTPTPAPPSGASCALPGVTVVTDATPND